VMASSWVQGRAWFDWPIPPRWTTARILECRLHLELLCQWSNFWEREADLPNDSRQRPFRASFNFAINASIPR
jgi:hypothetical protein